VSMQAFQLAISSHVAFTFNAIAYKQMVNSACSLIKAEFTWRRGSVKYGINICVSSFCFITVYNRVTQLSMAFESLCPYRALGNFDHILVVKIARSLNLLLNNCKFLFCLQSFIK
jgi:hypothetical protein